MDAETSVLEFQMLRTDNPVHMIGAGLAAIGGAFGGYKLVQRIRNWSDEAEVEEKKEQAKAKRAKRKAKQKAKERKAKRVREIHAIADRVAGGEKLSKALKGVKPILTKAEMATLIEEVQARATFDSEEATGTEG